MAVIYTLRMDTYDLLEGRKMEYLPFYALFLFWFVATVASVPSAPSDEKKMGELKEGRFGITKIGKTDYRKAA